MPKETTKELSKDETKETHLDLLLDDLTVMQKALMMEINSAHLTANIAFCPYRHFDASNTLRFHMSLYLFGPRNKV